MHLISPKLTYNRLDNSPTGGPRSEAEAVVQMVCSAGDYSIDLQLEPEFEAGEMALVGQIVNRTASSELLAGATVRLMARSKLLAATQTNSAGEFCIVSRFQNGLKLYIDIEAAGQQVGIPLRKLTAGFGL